MHVRSCAARCGPDACVRPVAAQQKNFQTQSRGKLMVMATFVPQMGCAVAVLAALLLAAGVAPEPALGQSAWTTGKDVIATNYGRWIFT